MGKVVLIVEDNEMNLTLIRDLLQMSGYTTLEAGDGEQATKITQEKYPDLILMDIHLPIMDGLEATSILKNDDATKNIPIIALTASVMKDDKEKINEAGCDGYIPKPIEVDKFLEQIAEFINKE
ncbi:MAG: response regulator [Candidatus Latescibacteria bacterium]|jgi:two-component system, cell cycle response regulator DivK|nr:response regulator [Candidatus Latescibacterota bacterium]